MGRAIVTVPYEAFPQVIKQWEEFDVFIIGTLKSEPGELMLVVQSECIPDSPNPVPQPMACGIRVKRIQTASGAKLTKKLEWTQVGTTIAADKPSIILPH